MSREALTPPLSDIDQRRSRHLHIAVQPLAPQVTYTLNGHGLFHSSHAAAICLSAASLSLSEEICCILCTSGPFVSFLCLIEYKEVATYRTLAGSTPF